MRVVENKGADWTLHDLVRDININVHATRLKLFHYDDSRIDFLYAAAKDYKEDEIQTILSQSVNPRRKPQWIFLFFGKIKMNQKMYGYFGMSSCIILNFVNI